MAYPISDMSIKAARDAAVDAVTEAKQSRGFPNFEQDARIAEIWAAIYAADVQGTRQ